MNEVKTKIYLNALKLVFPYDNKVLRKLITRATCVALGVRNEGDNNIREANSQSYEISSERLSHIFHKSQKSELFSFGLTEAQVSEFLGKRSKIDPEVEYALLLKEQVGLISRDSIDYPSILKELPDAPEILYVQGKKSALINQKKLWSIAIVGTRAPSPYGRDIAETIVRDLYPYGPTIVSGLASGIDQAAHEAAIEHGLPTIAVLGAGHGSLRPKHGLRLIKKLLDDHLIVSEYPYGVEGSKWTFPQRNRIICGLSIATVVVEARSSSGALITAKLAAQYNRDVFAVPGSILSAYSRGTNHIIQKGEAELFMDVPTMIDSINIAPRLRFELPDKQIKPELKDPLQKLILDTLKHPMDVSDILTIVKSNIRELLVALTALEICGLIKQAPDQKWIRVC